MIPTGNERNSGTESNSNSTRERNSTRLHCLITTHGDGYDHFECEECKTRFKVEQGTIPMTCPACYCWVRSAEYNAPIIPGLRDP